MTSETRRQLPLLVGLVVVLAAVTWWQFGGTGQPAAPAGPARGVAAGAPAGRRGRGQHRARRRRS